jgi:hypothetical protein
MNTVPLAPTVDEIRAISAVQTELEAAWVDSLPADPALRHEEGGWIYFSHTEIEYQVRRSSSGGRAFLDLIDPPGWKATSSSPLTTRTRTRHRKAGIPGRVALTRNLRTCWEFRVLFERKTAFTQLARLPGGAG